jgi:PAS domain S-box-containing protein
MRAGTITWDERLEAIFGIAPGSFDGSFDTYVGMLHPDDREGVLAEVRRAVEGKSSYRVEHRVVWPDGSTHWISGAGTVTRDNEGEVTGTVGCTLDVTDRVSGEIERRQLVAAAVAAADNERLQRERLEVVSSINDGLNQSDSVRSAMVNATSRSVPRLGDWCSIHVLAESGSQIPLVHLAHADPQVLQRGRELLTHFPYDPHSRSGVANVIRTGDTVFYPEISDEVAHDIDASAQARHIISGLALRSVIIVPLVKRGKILGAMQFAMTTAGRQYTFDDVALAEAVAGRVASSIQNHRLNDQQREIATTLQRSLLPHRLPEIDGVDVAVRYWPAGERTEVGGDFYDVFGVDDQGHNFAVVIGDVCGTGPGAAALTGLARHSIRASAWHGDHPVDVLASLDRAVKRSGADTFLTALYSEIRRSGDGLELTIAAGGHPLPVLVNAQGAQTIGHPGSLLGAVDSPAWSATSVRLGPDDVVVFYTDGATDLRRPHGLSATQFADLARDAVGRHDTAEAIADTIHQRLEAIVSFEHRDDDIALLILRVASAPSSLEDGEGKGDRARSHDRDGGPTQHRGQSVVAVRAHDHPIGRHQ